nr:ATP-binding cassette domain-containing protein [Clostridia bacterium]
MAEARKEKQVLLTITNLKKYFPVKNRELFSQEKLFVRANEDISINIYQGETFGLVGESGCGKSTLGRVLLQLYHQTDGRTMYYGRTLDDLAPNYVYDVYKHLKKHLQNAEKLRLHHAQLQREFDALTDEKAKWAMQDKVIAARKAAEDAHVDIAKLVGGFAAAGNPSEVSPVLLREYQAAAKVFRTRDQIRKLRLEIESLREEGAKSADKLSRLEAKLRSLQASLEKQDRALEELRSTIQALRARYADVPGFQQSEALRDDGVDLAKLTPSEMRLLRKDLQLIFQDPYSSLNPRMTVAQLIGEGLVAHEYYKMGSSKMQDYILKVMDNCGLAPYMMHRYPHQFSGGQRQRIGIARALALRPKFVVCDEAVSALDVSIQSQVLNLLLDMKEKENLTYLFISHDLSVIKYISDRIGVMYLGNLVELADTEEMFAHPMHPYTEALLGAIPTTDPDASKELVLIK